MSLKFRVGELWREHLKDLTRAIEAYRGVLQMDPTHEPTLRALEALMAGAEPVLAATVLEPIYESAGEWDRVIAVYEVMQANAEDAAAQGRAPRRIAELEERRLSHQSAAFEAYGARCTSTRRTPTCSSTCSASRPTRATGPSSRRSSAPSWRASRTRAARST